MPQPFVRYEVADAIAHIVLDRPPVNLLISSALFASAPNVKKCTPAMRSVGSFACASATQKLLPRFSAEHARGQAAALTQCTDRWPDAAHHRVFQKRRATRGAGNSHPIGRGDCVRGETLCHLQDRSRVEAELADEADRETRF
jgi:hypothetical protein